MELWNENQALRRKLADARRWAAAWKEGARANHDVYQFAYLDYLEAMRQYDHQQRRACDAEVEIERLREQVRALQMMLQTAPPVQRKYITRPCMTPGCENMALFDPLTNSPALCIECRLEIP